MNNTHDRLSGTKTAKLMAAVILASSMSAAQSAYLVDTGTPNLAAGGVGLVNFYYSDLEYQSEQHLAASFNIANASTITSLAGYMRGNEGGVTYELRQGGPTGSLLYSGFVSSVGSPDYYTVSGLNVPVAAGGYTLNFLASSGFQGEMTSGAPALPDALTAIYFSNDTSTWNTDGGVSYGVRVGGNSGGASGVPAPLPLLGVLGAFAWSRKLRNRIRLAKQRS